MMKRTSTLFGRRVSALITVVAVLFGDSGCAKKAAPTAAATPTPVRVAIARFGSVVEQRALAGVIAPMQNVVLSTTLSEPASRVNVVEGDHVRAGEVIASFDVADLRAGLAADERAAAEAQANAVKQQFQSSQTIGQGVGSAGQAQASLDQAVEKLQLDHVNLDRDVALQGQGFIAPQTTDAQRTTVQNDVAAVAAAKAALASAQVTVATNGTSRSGLQGASIEASRAAAASARAQADQIRAQISRADLVSPVDGIVTNRNLNPDEYPNGRTLFTIQQTGDVYAILNATGAQLEGVRRGTPAHVVLNGGTQTALDGPVVAILGQPVPGSTNFTVKVELHDPTGRLLAGSAVTGMVELPAVSGVTIPRAAFTDATESHVIAIDGGVARTVAVRRIAEDTRTAVVTGLRNGSRLVADGDGAVSDGAHVVAR